VKDDASIEASAPRPSRRGVPGARLEQAGLIVWFVASGGSCVAGGRFHDHDLPFRALPETVESVRIYMRTSG
jgi:hypothetical protein